ncbi:MAG: hypothetical protein ABSD69_03305 [Candidatus Levyibacteriota bacterium]|jgi:hypothetical protein
MAVVIELDLSREINKPAIMADCLTRVFDVFENYGIDARLVGSLGRFASISKDPPSLDSVVDKGKLKDIDVVIFSPDRARATEATEMAREAALPCKLDICFGTSTSEETPHSIQHKDISVDVDPKVFEKREGHILGITVPTLNPNTLFHLHDGVPFNRKTFRNLYNFRREIRNRGDLLPEEMYAPFHEFRDVVKQIHPNDVRLVGLRIFYHAHVPKGIRNIILPITSKIRGGIERIT